MVGQTVVSISQAFALPVPPFLASIWFSSGELGIAASLALPPVMVKNHDSLDAIGDDLQVMAYWIAGASTLCFLLAARPPTPPSPEQALKKSKFNQDPKLMHVLKNLSKNPCYLLILTSYCINQGVVNSVTALLNPLILPHFKDGENFAGRIGMTFTIVQMTGTFLCGFVLDKTCKYKFFLGGYVSIACCYSLEVTYPEPEGTSGGLLTLFAMTASVLITLGYGAMIRSIGDEWANSAITLLLIFGTVLHFFMKPEYRRQNAHNSAKVMAKQQESRSSNFERNEYNTCSEVAIPQDLRPQYTNIT
ncbi:Feline leukemia virus subgroup C receptor-related protein 2 [Blattella germanica]|nr:Feline leukemia virus subgroup C receptor-related protein 2 [Blattella germanica]